MCWRDGGLGGGDEAQISSIYSSSASLISKSHCVLSISNYDSFVPAKATRACGDHALQRMRNKGSIDI